MHTSLSDDKYSVLDKAPEALRLRGLFVVAAVPL